MKKDQKLVAAVTLKENISLKLDKKIIQKDSLKQ